MNWLMYTIIALIIMIIGLICFIIKDMDNLDLIVLIEDITEAAVIAVGWAISVPLLAVANIIVTLLLIVFGEEDGEE